MGETFDVQEFSPWRKCRRCGTVQRGIYDADRESITWQTLRERTFDRLKHGDLVRRPLSGFDELAHSLGLRRSRQSDRTAARDEQR